MAWENIGECGDASASDRDWMVLQTQLAIDYITHVCGELPAGCELDLMWHEHELADYVSVGISWEPPEASEPPWDYIVRAQATLRVFNDAVDWRSLEPALVRESVDDLMMPSETDDSDSRGWF